MMMRIFSNVKDFYNDINGATLTGAIDVIVVEQPDGTFSCSPFHVRFGKLGVLRSKEKVVDIEVNGTPLDIHMKLGESGEAFFVEDLGGEDESDIPEHLATSPIPVSEIEQIFHNQGRRRSLDFDHHLEHLDNESNSYEKRRYTADNEMINNRTHLEMDFLKRQIGLGNIDGASVEDVTLSLTTGSKRSDDDDLSRSQNDVSETIFKMDSLEEAPPNTATNKVDNSHATVPKVVEMSSLKPVENPTEMKNSKKKRKKMRKKNSTRKQSTANNGTTNLLTSPSSDTVDNHTTNESITDRSSLESNCSETEAKDLQKNGITTEIDGVASSSKTVVPQQQNQTVAVEQQQNSMKKVETDFHFFSDTELTTGNAESRSSSPAVVESVQSDSEIEMKLLRCKDGATEPAKSWEWGGFPNITPTTSPVSEVPTKEAEQKSMLSSVFSFMKSKHNSAQSRFAEGGGVYLSEITSGDVDRNDIELYFNQRKRIEEREGNDDIDMDCESGNGPSLTHSPEGCKSIDSDFDEQTKLAQTFSQDIALSLSGWDPQLTEERFNDNLISFTDLCNNPAILENPKLVAKINKKFYSWKVAAPMLVSLTCFGRPLLQSCLDQLSNTFMPIQEVKEKQEDKSPSYKFWHHWTRSKSSRESTPLKEIDNKTVVDAGKDNTAGGSGEIVEDVMEKVEEETLLQSAGEQQNMSINKSIKIEENQDRSLDKCRKTLRLSSKQIGMLDLRDGVNEIEFSVTTAYQGTTRCQCHLYKWKWDDKIVISDIDGTITKSDVLGHILPIVGKDWAQSGVAQLFNKIKNNGYKLLYLSARAIGQARITREYLKSIKQGDMYMPDGPILLNPTSLITAFHREVIEKKPEAFKISCMSDIKALFPPDSEPFYAGYGNRINDVWAYRAVGIPIHRIFTINPKGELKHELTQTFQSSYSNMSILVDQMFPSRLEAANDYSHFSYWRDPIIALEPLPELI